MGASEWRYVAPFDPDAAAVLLGLQRSVLSSGDYYWGGDDEDRPSSVDELRDMSEDEEFEDIVSEGTHSILDIELFLPPGSPDDFAAVVMLSEDESVAVFGTPTPTRAEYSAVAEQGRLPFDFPRWSGRAALLFEGDRPTEIAFWGFSGD